MWPNLGDCKNKAQDFHTLVPRERITTSNINIKLIKILHYKSLLGKKSVRLIKVTGFAYDVIDIVGCKVSCAPCSLYIYVVYFRKTLGVHVLERFLDFLMQCYLYSRNLLIVSDFNISSYIFKIDCANV